MRVGVFRKILGAWGCTFAIMFNHFSALFVEARVLEHQKKESPPLLFVKFRF